MASKLRILLIGGPMYGPLYSRLSDLEEQEGVEVEVAGALPHPELNERIEEEFDSGEASYDLISTHMKYAPSQARWLSPLDEDLDDEHLRHFSPLTLELARINGIRYNLPRMLDVKLLLYRTNLLSEPPTSWEELLKEAEHLRSGETYGFVFPGKESGLFGHFFELHAMAEGQVFEDGGSPRPHLNDEPGRWALGLLKDLYERAAPRETPEWHYDEVAACFRDGKAAMSTDWPGGFYTYGKEGSAVANRFSVALYPEGRAGRFVYAGCHTFAIPTTVRDRPATLALLRFLTSQDSQTQEACLGTLPAREDSLEDARSEAPEGSLAVRRWDLLEEAKRAALIPPKHENYPAVEDAIWQGIREALLGHRTIEEALSKTEEKATRAAEGPR